MTQILEQNLFAFFKTFFLGVRLLGNRNLLRLGMIVHKWCVHIATEGFVCKMYINIDYVSMLLQKKLKKKKMSNFSLRLILTYSSMHWKSICKDIEKSLCSYVDTGTSYVHRKFHWKCIEG